MAERLAGGANPGNGKQERSRVWHKARVNLEQMKTVGQSFKKLYFGPRTPDKVALFAHKYCDENSMYTIYFSPEASTYCRALVDLCSAEPCETPYRSETALLFGHHDDLAMLR
jgi:hypothetical protein